VNEPSQQQAKSAVDEGTRLSAVTHFLVFISARAAFRECVFNFLREPPQFEVRDQLLILDLKTVRVHKGFLGTDIAITFSLKDSGSVNIEDVSRDPRELAAERPPTEAIITFGLEDKNAGEQVFHFTFSSREDFAHNLKQLRETIATLYDAPEVRRLRNDFFFDHLNRFMKSEGDVVSEKPLRLPHPESPFGAQTELKLLERELVEELVYHQTAYARRFRADTLLSLLLVILPISTGSLLSVSDVNVTAVRTLAVGMTFIIAVIAVIRTAYNLPARVEAHRLAWLRYQQLMREFELQRYASTGHELTAKSKELKEQFARVTFEVRELTALAPRGLY
jgi:hypothetical protein